MATAKRTTSGKKPAKTATKRISFNLNAPERSKSNYRDRSTGGFQMPALLNETKRASDTPG